MADPVMRPDSELPNLDEGKTLEQFEVQERLAWARRTYRHSNGEVSLPVDFSLALNGQR